MRGLWGLALLALVPAAILAGGAPPEVARIVPDRPENAYATPAPAPPGLAGLDARAGAALFDRPWAAAPASTRASDGLGPLYAARACAACHTDLGRAHPPPHDGALPPGMVVRLAGPSGAGDPILGHQVQPLATGGMAGEGWASVLWHPELTTLADGTRVDLRRPQISVSDLAWGAPRPDTRLSLRAAPPLVGLGLIAAIDPADLLAAADAQDQNGDGVRGRVRWVAPLDGGAVQPGRFGRRAGAASLPDAIALALSTDMGLSTPYLPAPWGDCTAAQAACRTAPHGDGDARVHEVAQTGVDLIAAHLASLAVPAGAPPNARGAALFADAGCAACHRPAYVIATPQGPRTIRPYSDFLLHDLGPGLADPAPEPGVAPGEWRTAPLWGLGHTAAVGGGRASYLHDGRAATLLEAVLWHGGTAQAARDRMAAMPAADRAALIEYLESL